MTVLGIDLSLNDTGLSNGQRVWRSKSSTAEKSLPPIKRVRIVAARVFAEVVIEEPVLVVIEGLAYASRTGMAAERAAAWFALMDRVDMFRVPYMVVSPTARAKYATGKGNAGKDEVLAAIVRRFPHVETTNNNEADALCLAAMGYDLIGKPLCDMPASHRVALLKVDLSGFPERACR